MRCQRCPLKSKFIPATGPHNPACLLVGEAGGKDENKVGKPFVGKTGRELNEHYLPCASLFRDNVYVTNAVKCMPDSTGGKLDMKNERDIDLLNSCASTFLYEELDLVKPSVIVPMGAFANYAIDPDINLELQHGIPLETSWGTTFPMYHPAGGIHEPKKMLMIRNDWIRLGKFLKGKLRVPRDKYPNPDYRVVDSGAVANELDGCEDWVMACDTETVRGGAPYCLTYSVQPGTGRLIKADDKETLATYQYYVSRWKGPILWHNWLYDMRVVAAMGLIYPRKRIVDTMVKVFHLGNLPQGLKALAFRELGMKMKDFDDVVSPYSTQNVLNYYRLAQMYDWPKGEEQLVRDKEGKLKLYKPQSFSTKLKRFFTDYSKNPSKDVFKMWEDNWEEMHEQVEERVGRYPGKCISHVPFDEMLWYACCDSDSLLRLWPIINRATKMMRKRPQEYWTGSFAA